MTKKLTSIGVLSQEGNNITYQIIKEILSNSGYEFLYDNNTFSILSNNHDFIMIFQLTKKIVDKIKDLNLCLDIVVDTGLQEIDYYDLSIRSLVKNSKYFIMNVDDKDSVKILTDDIESLIVTYGLNTKATLTASSLVFDSNIRSNICLQRECTTIKGKEIEPMEFPVTINLIGRSNFYNSLAAVAFGIIYGIPIEIINSTLQNIETTHRRLEKICHKDWLIVLDNYCEDSSDYNFVFEEIQCVKYNNMYVIKGIDEDEEPYDTCSHLQVILDWHPIANIKKIFLYMEKNNNLINKDIESLFSNQLIHYGIYSNLQQCVSLALNSLNEGDVLLILGKNAVNNVKEIVCQLI